MKRLIVLFAILLLIPLPACSESDAALSTQSPSPVPAIAVTPTATPVAIKPVIAVFGADEAPAFLEGIRTACEESGNGVEILQVTGGLPALGKYSAGESDAAIVYLTGSADQLPKASIPVFVFAAEGQDVPVEIPHLTYNGETAPRLALNDALSYPPHLAPVRLIGLFTSQSSSAYALWTGDQASGKVFAKEEFFQETSEVPLAEWLSETLPLYYPGMLDAIYAETGALAIAAADALASLGRDDVEVFSAGTDADANQKLSSILVCTVGINPADAGARCFAEAAKLLTGGSAQSGVLLPEAGWFSKKQ